MAEVSPKKLTKVLNHSFDFYLVNTIIFGLVLLDGAIP